MFSLSIREFYKEDESMILLVHIYTDNLTGVAISINKSWETRYSEYKLRLVSKKEFEKNKNPRVVIK